MTGTKTVVINSPSLSKPFVMLVKEKEVDLVRRLAAGFSRNGVEVTLEEDDK